MNGKMKNILKYSLSLIAAAALLYFSFKGVSWHDFGVALKVCSWEYVILSMVVGSVVLYLRALRWRMMLLPIDPSTTRSTMFNAVNIGMLVNIALPRVGEIVRCGVVARNSALDENGERKASMDKALGTGIADRVWDVMSLVIFLILALPLLYHRGGSYLKDAVLPGLKEKADLWWIALAVVAAIIVGWLLLRVFSKRSSAAGSVLKFFTGMWDGFKSCLKMKDSWKFFVLTAIIWVGYWMMSETVLLAIQGMDPSQFSDPEMARGVELARNLTIVDALILMVAGSISSLVPVPGGFGAFHTIVAGALLSIYGVPFPMGLIFATLSHESQVLTDIILGAYSYASEAFKKRK